MKKIIITGLALSLLMQGFSQASVGIGTTSPNSRAILDLNSTTQVFLPPRMSTQQMGAIAGPPLGSLIYNNDVKRYMAYTNTHFNQFIVNGNLLKMNVNKWLPLSTGPKVLAWGSMDSSTGSSATYIIAPIKAGSGNFEIRWYKDKNGGLTNWYELVLTNDNFDLDSMLLIVTPVGNGSWDMAVAIGEIPFGGKITASIKFIDISRSIAGWSSLDVRRRSKFHFVLYDMRGY